MKEKLQKKYQVLCLYKNGELYESIEYETRGLAQIEYRLLRENNIYTNNGIKRLEIIPIQKGILNNG